MCGSYLPMEYIANYIKLPSYHESDHLVKFLELGRLLCFFSPLEKWKNCISYAWNYPLIKLISFWGTDSGHVIKRAHGFHGSELSIL